jgi:HSP20 family protein
MSNLTKYSPRNLWDPFRSLGEIHDEFDRLFNRFTPQRFRHEETLFPAVDLLEEKEKYVAKVELPGMEQKDIKVTLNDNVLTIRGERKSEYEEKKEGAHRIERSFGSFNRSFSLDKEVIPEEVKANYKDGVLTIDMPKSNKEVKDIEVKIH